MFWPKTCSQNWTELINFQWKIVDLSSPCWHNNEFLQQNKNYFHKLDSYSKFECLQFFFKVLLPACMSLRTFSHFYKTSFLSSFYCLPVLCFLNLWKWFSLNLKPWKGPHLLLFNFYTYVILLFPSIHCFLFYLSSK